MIKKNNKAADAITGEVLKHGGEDLIARLIMLLNKRWKEQVVPIEWQHGVTVELPKKGDASDCNNCRGSTLLSVPEKFL